MRFLLSKRKIAKLALDVLREKGLLLWTWSQVQREFWNYVARETKDGSCREKRKELLYEAKISFEYECRRSTDVNHVRPYLQPSGSSSAVWLRPSFEVFHTWFTRGDQVGKGFLTVLSSSQLLRESWLASSWKLSTARLTCPTFRGYAW